MDNIPWEFFDNIHILIFMDFNLLFTYTILDSTFEIIFIT